MRNVTPAVLLDTSEDFPETYEEGHYWLSQDGNTLFVILPGLGDMRPLPLNDQSAYASDIKGRWSFNPDTVTLTPSIHCLVHYTAGKTKTLWHGWLRDGTFQEI